MEALELVSQLGMRSLTAHCYFGLGELFQRAGKRHQALRHAKRATIMYREMDMPFWLERADELAKQVHKNPAPRLRRDGRMPRIVRGR